MILLALLLPLLAHPCDLTDVLEELRYAQAPHTPGLARQMDRSVRVPQRDRVIKARALLLKSQNPSLTGVELAKRVDAKEQLDELQVMWVELKDQEKRLQDMIKEIEAISPEEMDPDEFQALKQYAANIQEALPRVRALRERTAKHLRTRELSYYDLTELGFLYPSLIGSYSVAEMRIHKVPNAFFEEPNLDPEFIHREFPFKMSLPTFRTLSPDDISEASLSGVEYQGLAKALEPLEFDNFGGDGELGRHLSQAFSDHDRDPYGAGHFHIISPQLGDLLDLPVEEQLGTYLANLSEVQDLFSTLESKHGDHPLFRVYRIAALHETQDALISGPGILKGLIGERPSALTDTMKVTWSLMGNTDEALEHHHPKLTELVEDTVKTLQERGHDLTDLLERPTPEELPELATSLRKLKDHPHQPLKTDIQDYRETSQGMAPDWALDFKARALQLARDHPELSGVELAKRLPHPNPGIRAEMLTQLREAREEVQMLLDRTHSRKGFFQNLAMIRGFQVQRYWEQLMHPAATLSETFRLMKEDFKRHENRIYSVKNLEATLSQHGEYFLSEMNRLEQRLMGPPGSYYDGLQEGNDYYQLVRLELGSKHPIKFLEIKPDRNLEKFPYKLSLQTFEDMDGERISNGILAGVEYQALARRNQYYRFDSLSGRGKQRSAALSAHDRNDYLDGTSGHFETGLSPHLFGSTEPVSTYLGQLGRFREAFHEFEDNQGANPLFPALKFILLHEYQGRLYPTELLGRYLGKDTFYDPLSTNTLHLFHLALGNPPIGAKRRETLHTELRGEAERLFQTLDPPE